MKASAIQRQKQAAMLAVFVAPGLMVSTARQARAVPPPPTSLNIDFGSATPVPSTSYGAAANQAGSWNAITSLGTTTGLVGLNGLTTAATVNVTASSIIAGGSGTGTVDSNKLVNDSFYSDPGAAWSVAFSNLDNGDYIVYAYAGTIGQAFPTRPFTINGTAYANLPGDDDSATFNQGVDYGAYGVTVTDGTITLTTSTTTGYGALSGLQLVKISSALPTTVIDFQNLQHVDDGVTNQASPYSEDGFVVENVSGSLPNFGVYGTQASNYPGSTALYNNFNAGITRVSRPGNAPFNLKSIDLSELNGPSAVTVSFTGTRADGTTVTQSFTTDGLFTLNDPTNNDAQTFNFTDFTDLVKVEWSQDSPYHQFDNIVLEALATAVAPVNTVPGPENPVEDTTVVFSGANAISVSDANGGNLQVTLGVTSGKLTLSQTTGLTFTDGDGTSDASMMFSGSIANINAALNGLSFAPLADSTDDPTLSITSSDGDLTDTDTVAIVTLPVNDAPSFTSGANQIVNEDASAQSVAWATNISPGPEDEGGQTVDFLVSNNNSALFTSGGQPAIAADGTLTFTPALNQNGVATVTVRLHDNGDTKYDGVNTSAAQTFTITIRPQNDAPQATADSYSPNEDGGLNVAAPGLLANDGDVDSSSLSAILVSGPTNGTLVLNADGSFTYTPQPNFYGADSFSYKLDDGTDGNTNQSNTVTVSLNVLSINDAPVASGQNVGTGEENALPITLVVGDVDDEGFTYSIVTPPSHGTLSGSAPNLTYTPNPNFNGIDSFTFRANDGSLDSNVATVFITVGGANDAPVAVDDTAVTLEDIAVDINVLANDTDVDNDAPPVLTSTAIVPRGPAPVPNRDTLTVKAVTATAATHGTLSIQPNGTVRLSPAANYNGPSLFTYTVTDGTLESTAEVRVSVGAVNDAPVALDSFRGVPEDTVQRLVLNADDVDGDDLTYTILTQTKHGTISGSAPNLTYSPESNYSGPDSFTFRVKDGALTSNVATVTISVGDINDAPVTVNDIYRLNGSQPLQVDAPGILANDGDVDGDPLTPTLVSNVAHGKLELGPTGSFSYTPTAGFNGTDSFTYKVSDGAQNSNTATVTLLVESNSAPTLSLSALQSTLNENGELSATVNLSRPSDKDMIIALSSNNSAVKVPASILIRAGQTSATFTVSAPDNVALDGNPNVTIGVTAPGYASAFLNLKLAFVPTLTLTVRPGTVNEDGGPAAARATLSRNSGFNTRLAVRLSSSDSGEARVPTDLTLPSGATSVSFLVAAIDDRRVDGTQNVQLKAAAAGYRDGTTALTVTDHGALTHSLRVFAEDKFRVITEQAGNVGGRASIVWRGPVLSSDIRITLHSSDPASLRVPKSVLLRAGQTSVAFPFTVLDDAVVNGTRQVWITAKHALAVSDALDFQVRDNDQSTLKVTLPSPSVSESAGSVTGTLVMRNTSSFSGQTIALSSSDPRRLTVPESVFIPANSSSAGFTFMVIDNNVADGSHPVTITATKAGMLPGSAQIEVTDDDAAARVERSSVVLSKMTAQDDAVRLSFSGPLDADEAQNAAHYQVQQDGESVEIESLSYDAATNSVVLSFADGALKAGQAVTVRWAELRDARGRALSGQQVVIAR